MKLNRVVMIYISCLGIQLIFQLMAQLERVELERILFISLFNDLNVIQLISL